MPEIGPGELLRLQNLVGRADLNGEQVQTIRWVEKSKRWAVRRVCGDVLSVRPENLEVLTSSDLCTLESMVSDLSGGALVVETKECRGRCVIATRSIKAGTVLFQEEPFFTIPLRGKLISAPASIALANKVFADEKLMSVIKQLYDGEETSSAFFDERDDGTLL